MALSDYLPFDPSGTATNTGEDLEDLFEALGIDAWEDVMTDIFDPSIDPSNIRGTLYNTAEEAFIDMANRGIWWFMKITYYPDIDMYSLYEDYPV